MSIEVRYLGHLGNNLFEYALGRILAEELGLELRCFPASDAPGWGRVERMSGIVDRLSACFQQFQDAPQTISGHCHDKAQIRYVLGEKHGWTGHGINLDYLLRNGHGSRIVLHGYFQRTEYYHPYRERIRRWYRFNGPEPEPTLRPQDVLVHLRQSLDMFLLDRAIDLDFYLDLLSGMSLGQVYVCGLGLGERVRKAFAPFNPIYLELPAIDTLRLMTRANRIVLANSTFSWWGAYLSDASEIYYPRVVRNFWSRDRAEVDLEVPEDRYRYIEDVAVQTWRPFSPVSGVVLGVKRTDTGTSQLAIRAWGKAQTALPIPSHLVPVCEWLERRRQPFGLHEIDEYDLPPHARVAAIKLLVVLCQLGVLHATPDAITGLAGLYGFSSG